MPHSFEEVMYDAIHEAVSVSVGLKTESKFVHKFILRCHVFFHTAPLHFTPLQFHPRCRCRSRSALLPA